MNATAIDIKTETTPLNEERLGWCKNWYHHWRVIKGMSKGDALVKVKEFFGLSHYEMVDLLERSSIRELDTDTEPSVFYKNAVSTLRDQVILDYTNAIESGEYGEGGEYCKAIEKIARKYGMAIGLARTWIFQPNEPDINHTVTKPTIDQSQRKNGVNIKIPVNKGNEYFNRIEHYLSDQSMETRAFIKCTLIDAIQDGRNQGYSEGYSDAIEDAYNYVGLNGSEPTETFAKHNIMHSLEYLVQDRVGGHLYDKQMQDYYESQNK